MNLLPGSEVIEFPAEIPKPHVGWNSIEILKEHAILKNIESGADFYFVHSYFVSKIDETSQVAACDYGVRFPAVIAKDNFVGVQFHPEKSQNNGDTLLQNFFRME